MTVWESHGVKHSGDHIVERLELLLWNNPCPRLVV
jgi:hypothetical protein